MWWPAHLAVTPLSVKVPGHGAALRITDETLAITFQVDNDSFFSYCNDFVFLLI